MFLGLSGGQPVYVFDRPVRLLVVDDDPIMREFAVAHLAMPGGTIVTAEDGEEAWAILEREPEPFDMVLSDLEMPRLTGYGLLERMRGDDRFAHLPIVVITSRDDMFAIDRAYETGATAFVAKPVNWRLLGHQLRYVLKASRMERGALAERDRAKHGVSLRDDLLTLVRRESQDSLHAMLGFADLLVAGLPAGSDLHAHASRARAAARGLRARLERAFAYSQLATGTVAMDPELVPAAHLVEEVVHAMTPEAERAGFTLSVEVEAAPDALVTGDLRHLSQALIEIVGNAIRHSGGGAATIRVAAAAEGRVTIRVADSGAGMDAALLERCRRIPSAEDSALDRRGLGLATARLIVERNGGGFAIESKEGAGTRVSLTFPQIARAEPRQQAA